MADEVHVRARVHLPEHPVDVERVGLQVEVETLREHDLEDVARKDVLLRHVDRAGVEAGAHGRAHVGQRLVRVGRLHERVRKGTTEVGSEHVEPAGGGVVRAIGVDAVADDHVVDEEHPLPPVVERGQPADDR